MAAEKAFENKVKKYLEESGAWYVKYWAGACYTKEGIPDILACIYGRFCGIEIKAPNGRPTLIQLATLRKIREAGGYGILLYPKDFENFKVFAEHGNVRWYHDNIVEQGKWFDKLNT